MFTTEESQLYEEWHRDFWDWMCWEVVEHPIKSVANMSHDEIIESILDDLLRCHFTNHKITNGGMKWYELFRFVKSRVQQNRVLSALLDDRVQELVFEDEKGYLRLIPNRELLHKAMNIAGVWYSGFEPPEGVEVLSLSDKVRELVDSMGVEGAAGYLATCFVQGISPDVTGSKN